MHEDLILVAIVDFVFDDMLSRCHVCNVSTMAGSPSKFGGKLGCCFDGILSGTVATDGRRIVVEGFYNIIS